MPGGAAGTSGAPIRPSGGSSGTSGWRSEWEVFAIFLVIAVAVALTNVFTQLADYEENGIALPAWQPAVWEFSSIAMLLVMLPAVMGLARVIPPGADRPWRWLAVHAAATIPFTVVHTLGMGVIRWGVYPLFHDAYRPRHLLGAVIYEWRKDVLSYAAIVGIYTLWRAYRAPKAAPPAPADDIRLEVRDGARRMFIRPADIIWIEAAGNYAALKLAGREVLHRATLASLERTLAAAGFVRVHRQRLVNRAEVAETQTNAAGDFTVTLRDGRQIGGSRRYRAALLAGQGA